MKFCKDCKHCIIYSGNPDPSFWECGSPKNYNGNNLLTGEPKTLFWFCETHRERTVGCSKDGKWFEPKGEIKS